MRFICGVVDRNGERRILAAESTPTLENIDDLALCAAPGSCDWGPDASTQACKMTAYIILQSVGTESEAAALAREYVDDVVRTRLSTDRMWILPVEEIEAWLKERRSRTVM